jgi:hypothetical protein
MPSAILPIKLTAYPIGGGEPVRERGGPTAPEVPENSSLAVKERRDKNQSDHDPSVREMMPATN